MTIRIPEQSGRDAADRCGMDLLAAHVPLTLLIDLGLGEVPRSRSILLDERPDDEELRWLTPAR